MVSRYAAGAHGPDAEPPGRLDRRRGVVVALGVEIVEVAHGGDAVEQHLAEREQRCGRHVVGAQPRRVAVQRLIAPRQKRQIVADPAQQRLEAVVVGVDGTGHHRAARPVDAPGADGARIRGDVGGVADAGDRAVDREHRRRAARAVVVLGARARRWHERTIRGDQDGRHRGPRARSAAPGSTSTYGNAAVDPGVDLDLCLDRACVIAAEDSRAARRSQRARSTMGARSTYPFAAVDQNGVDGGAKGATRASDRFGDRREVEFVGSQRRDAQRADLVAARDRRGAEAVAMREHLDR